MKILILAWALLISACSYAQEMPKTFAVVIIGGGPAGLSCASACMKAGYPTILCDEIKQGVIYPNLLVTNWPGHPQMDWQKTLEELRKDFIKAGGIIAFTHAKSVTKNQGVFHVSTDAGIFHAPAIVVATGRKPIPMRTAITTDQPTRILSRLYDPSFLNPSDSVAIIGSGEYALYVASEVASRVKRIYLFLSSQRKTGGSPLERILQRLPNITWMKTERITAINSQKTKVSVEAVSRSSKIVQEASWVILAEEWIPQSLIVRPIIKCDSSGAIITYNDTGVTPTSGLFACGEVTSPGFLNGIAAAAEGLQTGSSVCQYLLGRGPLPAHRPLAREEAPPAQGTTGATDSNGGTGATGAEEQGTALL
jgi:thioredoxin reductase